MIANIYKSGLRFLNPLTAHETYSTIVEEAIKLVKGDDGLVLLKNQETFRVAYGYSKLTNSYILPKQSLLYKAHKTRTAFTAHKKDFKIAPPDFTITKAKSMICVPLLYRKEPLGTLAVFSRKRNRQFSKSDLESLELFGTMSTLAIRKTQLYEDTKKAFENRDLFISATAHKLRTPLTSIHGYIQLLQEKLGNSERLERKWIHELSKESNKLIILIKEFLEAGTLQNGKLQYDLQEKKLSEVIKNVLERFRLIHPKRQVLLTNTIVSSNDLVICDFDKLSQAFLHILNNAEKFSSFHVPIYMNCTAGKTFLKIAVKDKGVGMSQDELHYVFEKFYKGAGAKGGMGLGLYLTKTIIDHHKGSISIRSKINKGTTVEVKLKKYKRRY